MRLLEAISRTGLRNRLVDELLDAQDGPEVDVQRGLGPAPEGRDVDLTS